MTLETIQSGSPPQGRELSQALVELQGLTFTLTAGVAADTNVPITGFTYGTDTIKSVLYFPIADVGDANAVTSVSDLTSEVKAGSVAASFQLETTATTGGVLLVIWFNKGAL